MQALFGPGPGDLPATAEDEILQRACANVQYTVNDMAKLRAIFAKHDADNSGSLDIDEFYALFEAKKNPFGDALFKMVDLDGDGEFLSFSEFVSVVSTYCLFGPPEVLRFAFNAVDEDLSGFISFEELDNLAAWLHAGGPSNLNTAIAKIKEKYDQGDGQISFESFKKIYREFPFLIHPAFALQENMMARVLGMSWWKRKQRQLGMVKEDGDERKRGDDEPTLLQTLLPSIFPHKKKLTPEEIEAERIAKEAEEREIRTNYGKSRALPPPGPEMLAYQNFAVEVAAVDRAMEAQRKARKKKAARQKVEAAAEELRLKKERTKKRRARMLSADLRDPDGEPLFLLHQPASVEKLFHS